MSFGRSQVEILKQILENSLQSQELDSHPWTRSLTVLDLIETTPELKHQSGGQQLVAAIGILFTQMMPSTAPRRKKRLDTNWGEFGILAAQYFAPLRFGVPSPVSLRDAWGHIDQSILLFVFGRRREALSDAEKEMYKLVGDELEVSPNSTISDWHRKGLTRLANLILAREDYLAKLLAKPAVITQKSFTGVRMDNSSPSVEFKSPPVKDKKRGVRRLILPLLTLILSSLILMGILEAWKIYNMVMVVQQDVAQVRELIIQPIPVAQRIKRAGAALTILNQDFAELKNELEPFLWVGPWLKWIPVYGGEMASIQDLVTVTDSLLTSAEISYQAVLPLVSDDDLNDLNPSRLAEVLKEAQPKLMEARQQLDVAVTTRNHLKLSSLSPSVQDLFINRVDPMIALMGDGLTVALELPRLMGATGEGPKTYLLLVQNEDELRPTGGFITAAGTLLVKDGSINTLNFQGSEYFDNWERPYPVAPWQLSQYMNSRVLIFRDANWYTNYPTTALYAEYLYSYTNAHSVDGVIAFDQHLLVQVLGVTGPIAVEGVPYLVDADNVVSYMRNAKKPTAEDLASPSWNNKVFINKLTRALIAKIFSGDVPWEQFSTMLVRALDEHHLLVQLDSTTMSAVLARNQWDGAVRPGSGDFLMVVDSNIGFNKTNAVVESSLTYDVDLTVPSSPIASLTVFHRNHAAEIVFCKHWNKIRVDGEQGYPITDCYWNYMRVYKKEGTILLGGTPQFVPDNWMILKQKNPGQVDILEEEIDGVQAFGTLQVLLGSQSLSTSFTFALPADILAVTAASARSVYHLKVQKQPGTLGIPITVRVHFPNHALIETYPPGSVIQDNNILYRTNLKTDLEFEVIFVIP